MDAHIITDADEGRNNIHVRFDSSTLEVAYPDEAAEMRTLIRGLPIRTGTYTVRIRPYHPHENMFHADVVDSSRETIFEDRAEILKMGRDLAMKGLLDVLHVEENMHQAERRRDKLRKLTKGIHYDMTIRPSRAGWQAEITGEDRGGNRCLKSTMWSGDEELEASEWVLKSMKLELKKTKEEMLKQERQNCASRSPENIGAGVKKDGP